MEKLRIAFIGCGKMASKNHFNQLGQMKNVEIVAACDMKIERAQKMAAAVGTDIPVFSDYRELLKLDFVDAVDIATPNYMHSEIAVAALEAGKHVFCEKPDAVSVEEALNMKKAAEKSGKVLMVMRNNRFLESSKYAKQFIEAGLAGEIYCGRCGWIRRRGIPGRGGWFTDKKQSGGGPLIDLGVHMIDLAIWLMGNPKPVSVSGCTYTKFAKSNTKSDSEHSNFGEAKADGVFDVEDLAMGFIRFENGACLQIEFSWASNIQEETRFVELRGTKAGLKWADGELSLFSEECGVPVDLLPKLDKPKSGHGHSENLIHFVNVLQNGETPVYNINQGVDMIKMLCAIYESAKTGREILL